MAKSKAKTPEKVNSAIDSYKKAVDDNTGSKGYKEAQQSASDVSKKMTQEAFDQGLNQASRINNAAISGGLYGANTLSSASTDSAIAKGSQMNEAQNRDARRYAAAQAGAAAAGAQSQATTAARAAGMNKAQAAMMGSQQNAKAYQNSYGNAYSQQLGNAANNQNMQMSGYNSAFENSANRLNNNAGNQQQFITSNQLGQQQLAATMQGANVSGKGNVVSMEQGQDAQNYAQGGLFSDERLKHYKECSKKVVVRSPSKIKALKYTPKGE